MSPLHVRWHGVELGDAYDVVAWIVRLGALAVIPFKRKETAAAWLLFFFLLPLPALLLFLAIGQPHFPVWRIERFARLRPYFEAVAARLRGEAPGDPHAASAVTGLVERLGRLPATGGNAVTLLDDYDATIRQLIADIDAAKRRVALLIYIFADDAVGRSVIAALGRAVARGVSCRVLLDPVGSKKWTRATVRALKAAGVETREALPFHWLRGRTRRDMRNHRKLFVIDGTIGYAGSQNLVSKSFRPGVVNRELVARCAGPVVLAMDAVIGGDWFLETQQAPGGDAPVPPASGNAVLQLLPSGADYPLEGFETLLVWQIHAARERVILVSPYFIPDEGVLGALRTAATRGVEIDIVLSKVVDQRLVNLAQRSFYAALLEVGARIHLFRDFLLHAKNVSIDGRLAIVGSSNVDLRSFQLNEEVSLFLLDDASVAALETIQRGYIRDSEPVDAAAWARRGRPAMFAENMARLISPLL